MVASIFFFFFFFLVEDESQERCIVDLFKIAFKTKTRALRGMNNMKSAMKTTLMKRKESRKS